MNELHNFGTSILASTSEANWKGGGRGLDQPIKVSKVRFQYLYRVDFNIMSIFGKRSEVSCCKFWIYWVGVNKKKLIWHIVKFEITYTHTVNLKFTTWQSDWLRRRCLSFNYMYIYNIYKEWRIFIKFYRNFKCWQLIQLLKYMKS